MHHRREFAASRFVNYYADQEQAAALAVSSSHESPADREPAQADWYAVGPRGHQDDDEPRYSFSHDSPPGHPDLGSFPTVPRGRDESAGTGAIAQDGSETPEDAPSRSRRGAHRLPTPPSALKGRAAVLAVAAGAVVAAGQAAVTNGSTGTTTQPEVALASDESSTIGTTAEPQAAQFSTVTTTTTSDSNAPQVLNVASPTDLSQFSNLLAKGQRFSEERAAREAAARRPLFVLPAVGTFTSSFGTRWGTLHAGVDIAAPIGTPIVAVADGEVIDSGPASGFGMWVRLRHADGTITTYGHINTSTVTVGQKVLAGDQIATVGNRGFSTGPHLHFEVALNGSDKIDPLPWLATRGISLGPEMD